MCAPLILASVEPLPVYQYASHEDDEEGQIWVRAIGKAKSLDAKAIFSTRDLYYLCARGTGDACGFWGSYKEAQEAREELADFLERSLVFDADLRLYAAPEDFGDSGVIPTTYAYIGPSDIRTWIPGFIEGEFFQVIREG